MLIQKNLSKSLEISKTASNKPLWQLTIFEYFPGQEDSQCREKPLRKYCTRKSPNCQNRFLLLSSDGLVQMRPWIIITDYVSNPIYVVYIIHDSIG